MSNIHQKTTLALDLGGKRVGLALSHGIVAASLGWLDYEQKESFFEKLKKNILEQNVDTVVVGLPLARNGQDTKQSLWVRQQTGEIAREISTPIKFVEESFSSQEASEFLGATKQKGEIDAYSAVAILERYLREGESGN
jgi:putative Holliday junction resolvase